MENAFIGDYLGTIEEFAPGEGTYVEEGRIYSATIGKVMSNSELHSVSVTGKIVPELEVGKVVYGDVMSMGKTGVTVIVKRISGFKNEIDQRTMIHVSNISDAYVDKPESLFAIGDIVKARVVKIFNGLFDISTRGEFGVVKAFCRKCRGPMVVSEKFEGKLECTLCKCSDDRKIAQDYGKVSEL